MAYTARTAVENVPPVQAWGLEQVDQLKFRPSVSSTTMETLGVTTLGALRINPQVLADYWPFRMLMAWNVGARRFEAQSHARRDESVVSRPVSFGVLTFFTKIALAG
jgi:hypothetical protein